MRHAAALTAVLALIAGGSSDAQRDARPPAHDSFVLQGRIVGADTSAGVADVAVTLRRIDDLPAMHLLGADRFNTPGVASARSGPDGAFELTDVPAGRYRLYAEPGATAMKYLPARLPDPSVDDAEPILVSTEKATPPVVLTLPRAAVITGQIVDGNGNPVALVAVRAQEAAPVDRRSASVPALGASSRTDDTGAFRLFGLHPGDYLVSAQGQWPGGNRPDPLPGNDPFAPPTFYPGALSPREAAPVRVTSGQEYGPIRFALIAVPVSALRALVVDAQGQPASTVSVSLRAAAAAVPGGSQFSTSRTTSSDGTVEFPRVPPGDYIATVSHYATAGSLFGWAPVTVVGEVATVTMRLQAGVSVPGRVVLEGQPPARLPTTYVRAVSTRPPGSATSPALVGPDQSFVIRDQFGPVFIRADALEGWFLKSVLLGGADITDRATEFAPDGPPVDVVLTQRAATLAGTVTTATGRPIDAAVVLINEDPAAWHERATTTRTAMAGADGKYRFEGLRAGRYLVVAMAREDGLFPGASTDYFELLARSATRVVVGDGASTTLDLTRVRLR